MPDVAVANRPAVLSRTGLVPARRSLASRREPVSRRGLIRERVGTRQVRCFGNLTRVALFALIVLSGCGMIGSPADDLRFQPPHGFTHHSLKRKGIDIEPSRVTEVRRLRICGNQDATYIRGMKQYAVSGEQRAEATFTVVNGSTYMLLYVRRLDTKPNMEAETALRELCPKS